MKETKMRPDMTDDLASRKAFLDQISDETGAGKYAGPGLLLLCPDDPTTRGLAIAGGAASVTRPDPDDGPDHDALVKSGIIRILGLGGRVTATLGRVPEAARLPVGAVCPWGPSAPSIRTAQRGVRCGRRRRTGSCGPPRTRSGSRPSTCSAPGRITTRPSAPESSRRRSR